jgi:hypothetical protein
LPASYGLCPKSCPNSEQFPFDEVPGERCLPIKECLGKFVVAQKQAAALLPGLGECCYGVTMLACHMPIWSARQCTTAWSRTTLCGGRHGLQLAWRIVYLQTGSSFSGFDDTLHGCIMSFTFHGITASPAHFTHMEPVQRNVSGIAASTVCI